MWGLWKEEKRISEGKVQSVSITLTFGLLWTFSIVFIGLGAYTITELVFIPEMKIFHTNTNYIVGIIYVPLGVILFIISTIKLWSVYKKQKKLRKFLQWED